MVECDEPLLDLVHDLTQTGAITAQKMYRARGWVCHHNTDLWRATAPIDSAFYGLWPLGGAWLCNALFERYAFTRDRGHLQRLYPIMKGAAQFFVDILVPDPARGWLVTSPSMSPEHEWTKGVTAAVAPTMDMQILRQLFDNCMEAAHVLDTDHADIDEWSQIRARLAPNQIGMNGQLQEWIDDLDSSAPEIAHRHMSPLYGLFPGHEITASDPRMMAAARRLMEMRTDKSNMGWALAWRVNLWARLGIVQGAVNFSPKSVIQLGLLLLIATPVARVILCVIGFARQHNTLYVAVSGVVLVILILSFFRAAQ